MALRPADLLILYILLSCQSSLWLPNLFLFRNKRTDIQVSCSPLGARGSSAARLDFFSRRL